MNMIIEPVVQTVTKETVEQAFNGKDYAFLFVTTDGVDKIVEASQNFEKAAQQIQSKLPAGTSAVFLRMVDTQVFDPAGVVPTRLVAKRKGYKAKMHMHPLAKRRFVEIMRATCDS